MNFSMYHHTCRPPNCILIPTPKIDEVRQFVSNSNPDLVFITETWLTNGIDTNYIHIPEYNIVCKKTVLVDPMVV